MKGYRDTFNPASTVPPRLEPLARRNVSSLARRTAGNVHRTTPRHVVVAPSCSFHQADVLDNTLLLVYQRSLIQPSRWRRLGPILPCLFFWGVDFELTDVRDLVISSGHITELWHLQLKPELWSPSTSQGLRHDTHVQLEEGSHTRPAAPSLNSQAGERLRKVQEDD